MKKVYVAPVAQKLTFSYKEQVVASSSVKKGKNNPGCYKANKSGERACAQY